MYIVIFDDKREGKMTVCGRTPSKMFIFATREAAESWAKLRRGIPDSEVLVVEANCDGSAVVTDLVNDRFEVIGETIYQSRGLCDGRMEILDTCLKGPDMS